MDSHLSNAKAVAEWLEADPRISYVNYAGLPSHPHHERAKELLPLGVGSVFSFGINGGRAAGTAFIEALQLASHLANIGDVRTLVLHPASTTHQQLTADQLVAAGVPEDLIRFSVGLEDLEDILWDLDQALTASQQVLERTGRGSLRRGRMLHRSSTRRSHDGSQVMTATETRTWVGPNAAERLDILRNTKSIAIVGASNKPSRASYFVATYLLSSSKYKVYFVNPVLDEILGQPVYKSLADLPETPDMVEVFRKHDDLPGVLDESIAVGAKTLWLQLGSWHEEVAAKAEANGLDVVMDRCVKIEHARFHGGLRLAGFNTGVISSKRQLLA